MSDSTSLYKIKINADTFSSCGKTTMGLSAAISVIFRVHYAGVT